jgi:hypothetical protein
MLQAVFRSFFHAWERRLSDVTKDRVVRPFAWGLDWLPPDGSKPGTPPPDVIREWVSHAMEDTDRFFTPPPTTDYTLGATTAEGDSVLSFPSAIHTPHRENNTVYCRRFPAKGRRAAVLVLPQWNSDPGGHVGLCRLLATRGTA